MPRQLSTNPDAVRRRAQRAAAKAKSKTPKPKSAAQLALGKLTKEDQEAVVAAVMKHPEGCENGKKKVLRDLGLPLPPPRAVFNLDISIEVRDSEVEYSSYQGSDRLKNAAKTDNSARLRKALEAAGFKVESSLFYSRIT